MVQAHAQRHGFKLGLMADGLPGSLDSYSHSWNKPTTNDLRLRSESGLNQTAG